MAGRLPWVLVVPAAVGMVFLVLPLAGLLVRAPWSTLAQRLAEPQVLEALRLSLVTATLATLVCLLLGVPLAWTLARVAFPGRRLVRALVTVPLVLPPVVGGVALLLVLGRRGLVGQWLESAFGITLPLVAPGLAAGAVLCWARALGEFGATITFAGNFPGQTQTMPLAVYLALETEPEAAIVLSLVLLAVSVIVLASLRDRWVNSP